MNFHCPKAVTVLVGDGYRGLLSNSTAPLKVMYLQGARVLPTFVLFFLRARGEANPFLLGFQCPHLPAPQLKGAPWNMSCNSNH